MTQKRPSTRAEKLASVAVVVVLALFVWVWRRESTRVFPDDSNIPVVAVLPFTDLGGDSTNAYLGDGIAESLISALSTVSGLQVAARTSSFTFRGQHVDMHDVSAKLGATTALSGTVLRTGDSLRIDATLVQLSDGTTKWQQTYDRRAADIFSVQNEIVRAVVIAMTDSTTANAVQSMPTVTRDLQAYELYMRGRFIQTARADSTVERSIELFLQATARDSAYALAWSALADAYIALSVDADVPAAATLAKARAASDKALALNGKLAEIITSRGTLLLLQDWSWRSADSVLRRATRLSPRYTLATRRLGDVYLARGQLDSALAAYHRAAALDPMSASAQASLALVLGARGDSAASQREMNEALALDSTQLLALRLAVRTYFEQRDSAQFFRAYDSYIRVSPRAGAPLDRLRAAWSEGGPNAVIQVQIGSLSVRSMWVESAMWRAMAKDYDGVFHDLEFAVRAHSVWLPVAAGLLRDPAITSDPRWAALRARMGMTK